MGGEKTAHTISLLVNNKPGALIRVAQVFTRRSFNINSINVSPSLDSRYSHMTITASGAKGTVQQIVLQLEKLIDVLHAIEHTEEQATEREMVLAKVVCDDCDSLRTFEADDIHSLVVEELDDHAILQITGETNPVDQAIKKLKTEYEIVELLRSGTVAITHANIIET